MCSFKKISLARAAKVALMIVKGELRLNSQVEAAAKFLTEVISGALDERAFREACGAGVVVTEKDVKNMVTKVLKEVSDDQFTNMHRMACCLAHGVFMLMLNAIVMSTGHPTERRGTES